MSSPATLRREAGFAQAAVPFVPAEAFATMIHDLRQPLSNIEAIAYYLGMALPPGDAKTQAHLARIRELVREANEILSSSVRAAEATQPSPQPAEPPNADLAQS
jgi:signal transduction histidine kinase